LESANDDPLELPEEEHVEGHNKNKIDSANNNDSNTLVSVKIPSCKNQDHKGEGHTNHQNQEISNINQEPRDLFHQLELPKMFEV